MHTALDRSIVFEPARSRALPRADIIYEWPNPAVRALHDSYKHRTIVLLGHQWAPIMHPFVLPIQEMPQNIESECDKEQVKVGQMEKERGHKPITKKKSLEKVSLF